MYSIDGGLNWVTEVYTAGIAPNDTVTYSFSTLADFSAFASVGGNIADSTFNVMFQATFPNDLDSTDNVLSYTVTNMVPPYTELSGLGAEYCLYNNIAPVIMTGVPGGGTFSGTGVQGDNFLMGAGGFPFAGPGTHIITYSFYDALTGCDGTDSDTVIVHEVPVVSIGGYPSLDVCQYDTIWLTGNFPGGEFMGTPFVNPTTGAFNPLISGNFNIQYAYTDGNGCTDTSDVYTFNTNPLPSVTIDNLSRAYCEDQSNIILNGNPSGGTFYIDNVAISGNIFNPNVVSTSVHSLGYLFTDINGCTDDFNINVKVFPLH